MDMMTILLRKKIVPAVLSILLGVVIVLARRAALDMLVRIIGWMVVVSAGALVGVYFARQAREPGSLGITLIVAGLTVMVGLGLVFGAEIVVDFFPMMMGIFLILNGMSNLVEAFSDPDNRLAAGLAGVLTILFGLLVVTRPGAVADAVMIYIGVFMILNGIFDLVLLHRMKNKLV